MQTEGPLYWAVMALHVYDQDSWKQVRVQLLKRIIVLAQARHSSPGGATRFGHLLFLFCPVKLRNASRHGITIVL